MNEVPPSEPGDSRRTKGRVEELPSEGHRPPEPDVAAPCETHHILPVACQVLASS